MSFILAGVGAASLLFSVGKGISNNRKGKRKEREGQVAAGKADLEEMMLNRENDIQQAQQQKGIETLADQRMSEISSLQSRYDEAAQEGIPNELKEQYLENIQSSQSQTLNANANRRGGLIGVASADQNAVGAYKELLSMDANQKLANERSAMGFQGSAIGQMDAYANRGLNFQIGNQQDNYTRDLSSNYADQDYAMALQGAGEQMAHSGMNQIGNALGQTASFAGAGGFDGLKGLGGGSPDGLGGGIGGGFNGTMAAPTQQSGLFPQTQGFGGQQQGWGTTYQSPAKGWGG
tara:strand:+ start:20336 stop:21211 length:876 start_codon:yes stop_codon:yes gene_type:complete